MVKIKHYPMDPADHGPMMVSGCRLYARDEFDSEHASALIGEIVDRGFEWTLQHLTFTWNHMAQLLEAAAADGGESLDEALDLMAADFNKTALHPSRRPPEDA